MPEPDQSFKKHAKFVPAYHFVLFFLLIATFAGALNNLAHSFRDHQRLYNAALILSLSVILLFVFVFMRTFPLKAQDRAIRAEENLRHFALTGKLLDPRLTVQQIVGLRFASDAEFPELAHRAAAENMPLKEIKRSVKNWRADNYRL